MIFVYFCCCCCLILSLTHFYFILFIYLFGVLENALIVIVIHIIIKMNSVD